MAKVSRKKRKKKIQIRLCITTITKRDIIQTYALNFEGQKTSIGLNNLYIDNWSKKKGFEIYLFYLLSSLVQERYSRGPSFD